MQVICLYECVRVCLLMTKPLLAPQLPARMVSHLYFMTHLIKRKKDLGAGGVGPNASAWRQVQLAAPWWCCSVAVVPLQAGVGRLSLARGCRMTLTVSHYVTS